MIRNFKILLLAGLALLAVGAVGAASAQGHATAQKFTNVTSGTSTVLTTEPDGTGTTAHQVFDVPGNGAITCNDVRLQGTVAAVSEPADITLEERPAEKTTVEGKEVEDKPGFTGCTFLGQPATVKMDGCKFTFTPDGDVSIVQCPTISEVKQSITFSAAGCTVTVKEQGPFVKAAKYGNVGTGGNEMKITAEVLTGKEIHSVVAGAGCITPGTSTEGQYTTGNTLVTGVTDPGTTQKPITVDF